MMMCLQALGYDVVEDEVNKVMGARPLKGAAWEQALACAQHYGVRGTLTMPSTIKQLKEWTDAGKPVMIGWNPEGREWSHASVVFDVDDDMNVHVADPNIPDPDETVRVVPKGEFYKAWYEKFPNYLVRRPALMLDREITPDGRQVMASRGKVDEDLARAWKKHVLRNQRRWDKHKDHDWFVEASDFAFTWKNANPRPGEYQTPVGRWAKEQAALLVRFAESVGLKSKTYRTAFNKYNAPELITQLLSVLGKEGLDDAVNQIRMKKIPQLIDKAWRDRRREASAARVASIHLLLNRRSP
jgi:hypothetical protein